METEQRLQSMPEGLSAGGFVILASVLSDQLNTFADIAPSEYAKHIPIARDELTEWVGEAPTAHHLPRDRTEGLKGVFTEVFERSSISTQEPSQEALGSLYADVYSTIREVASDLRLFAEIPIPRRRTVRDLVVSMFRGVFTGPRSKRRVFSIADAARRAKSRLERARELLPVAIRPQDDTERDAIFLDEVARERGVPSNSQARSHHIFTRDSLETDRYGVRVSVPPNDSVVGDRIYRIWFGTNRAPIAPTDPARGFQGQQDTRLHYGYCHVFVPVNHALGVVKTSWLQRFILVSVGDSLELRGIFPQSREDFATLLQEDLSNWSGQRTGLVYVHGFNNTFEQAALTAAQLGCDLEVNGAISFYSWPSSGKLKDYFRDGETTSLTFSSHFVEFVETLALASNLDRIDIVGPQHGQPDSRGIGPTARCVAHITPRSHRPLGARGARCLSCEVRRPGTVLRPSCTEPGDAVFLQTGPRTVGIRQANGYQRIGFEPPPYCHKLLDTVSVSPLKLDFLAHGYFSKSRPVIEDLKQLLWTNAPPNQRNLQPVPSQGVVDYWRLRRT